MNIDEEIISLLKENSRYTNKHIADKLGLSEGAVRYRIRRLVEEEKIRKFTIKTPSIASALCMITTDAHFKTDKIIESIKKNPYAADIYEVSGECSIICKIESADLTKLNDAVEAIRGIKGVINTNTYTILKEH